MLDVQLEGLLGQKFGGQHKLAVDSVFEVFEALEANGDLISRHFADLTKLVSHFIVYIDDKAMPAHLLRSKNLLRGKKSIRITPILQGGGPIATIIAGIIMVALSVVLSIVLSPKAPKDVKTNSSILGGVRNVTNRNIVVPLGYGRLRVGSAVISNDIKINQLTENSASDKSSYYDFVSFDDQGLFIPVNP